MSFTFTNFADSKLATGISSTSTQVTIATADASLFATFTATGGETQRAVIYDGTNTPELVDITLRADEVLDITRAVESTTAQDWPAGSVIRAGLTAGMIVAAVRVIGGESGVIDVTNGDGLTGTTLISLASEINLASKTVLNMTASDATFAGDTTFAGTVEFTGNLLASAGVFSFGGSASQGHELRLLEDTDNGTNYLGLKVPDSLATSYRIVFPDDAGATGQALDIQSISTDVVPIVTLDWGAHATETALGTTWADIEEFSAYQLGLGAV